MIKKQLSIIICLSFLFAPVWAAQTDWANGNSGAVVRAALQANDTELYAFIDNNIIGTDTQAWDAFLDDIGALTDPGADRILFWDDSGTLIDFLIVGTGLTITDKTISATGGGSGDVTAAAIITATAIVVGDDGAKGVKETGVLIDASDNITGVTSIDITPSAAPTLYLKDSDSLDADKTIMSISANATTVTAGAVESDVTFNFKNGSQASGVVTEAFHIDGANDQVEFAKNTLLQAGDIIASEIADWYAYDPIPIAWMNGGTSEPDALDITTRTPYAYRTFDPTADEDLNFVWFVPSDLSGTTIQFRVKYLVTNATGPSAEGVAFGLSGVSLGDNDLTNAAKGTVVVITDPTITAVQHDILITGWSGDVTITNLLAGEVAEVALIRDVSDAADTYAQVVGVFAIEIRYVRNVAR